ncbi:hypothetical protein [Primorskyibacter sedentarius]|uniref:Uncharacterized protein n=1 Tax=Primorskyibacter sedentarius TaxID=745311 RepID=A0A4R3JLJ7_9RHOB|nr:hypothetical protein [Primorskyibacter sedentarius]TCS67206.1 hypothetical protein EDD52_101301 [Primorskyibacter sedentarius]
MTENLRRQIESLIEQLRVSDDTQRDWLMHRMQEAVGALENLGEEVPAEARELLNGGRDADTGFENFPV